MRITRFVGMSAIVSTLMLAASVANAATLQVTITNNAMPGGVYLTPVWVGIHDGSFDSYDGGTTASAAIEAIAEDGNVAPLNDLFSSSTPNGVQGVVGGAPIAPGQTVTLTIEVADDGSNNYFSYASMVLPSSDYFVANGDPLAHSIASVLNGGSPLTFNIGTDGTINDAGTEINDFATTAGNGLFGIPGGQGGPNQGADEGGLITNVAGDPYASFLNLPGQDLAALNFNDTFWYPNGIATVTITAVPVPAALPLFAGAMGLLGFLRRRRA